MDFQSVMGTSGFRTIVVRSEILRVVPMRWLALCATLAACDGAPPREKFPGGQGRTTDSQAETTKAVMGGFDPLQSKLPQASGGGPYSGGGAVNKGDGKEPAAKESIRGTLTLGKKTKLREGAYLFIAARRPEGGPPLAAIRDHAVEFPYKFTLSSQNAMMAGGSFEGEVEITARLDQDGDPLTRQKGDYIGTLKTQVGNQKADIVIDQEIQE